LEFYLTVQHKAIETTTPKSSQATASQQPEVKPIQSEAYSAEKESQVPYNSADNVTEAAPKSSSI